MRPLEHDAPDGDRPLRILSVFGTRPEAIKMAAVLERIGSEEGLTSLTCVTAQHRQMLDPLLALFGIEPDFDLDIMRPEQDLFDLTARILTGMRGVLSDARPDFVLVQGDTTTCFAAALAGFYASIPVGHVEAGLRTGDLSAPFPEEANRSLVSRIATLHFAPTARSRANLLREGVDDRRILVTGNTVIDTLLEIRDRLPHYAPAVWQQALGEDLHARLAGGGKCILITGHRRENFGAKFVDICHSIRELAQAHADWMFVYPVHLNPNVRRPAHQVLARLSNVFLIEPLDYLPFVWLMNQADLILTDSGGIQEEAPSLGKPVLVMREVTERPEAVEAGTVRLVGTDPRRIVDGVQAILTDPALYAQMARAHNPYGDGRAAARIVAAINQHLRSGRSAPSELDAVQSRGA
jgi:UDP-N-acetylglucosamine 2-epimerase (non-hydrolysing)